MNTPRMKEAWERSSRTADGLYSSATPMSVYARSCYEEGCKLENELTAVTEQRDALLKALEECKEDSIELLGERNWWKDEPRCDHKKRYEETSENITRADKILAIVKRISNE
jgi:hypothetical protein